MSQTRNERALILEIENVPHGGSQESLLQVLASLMYWAGERDLQEQVGDLIKFVNNTTDSSASLEELLELLDATDAEDATRIIKELLPKNEVPGVEESPGTDLQRLES
jgi:predicted Zn-dependent peptidase